MCVSVRTLVCILESSVVQFCNFFNFQDLKAEVKDLKEKLTSLKQHLSTVTQEKDKLWTENSQFQFDLADLKTQLKDKEDAGSNVSMLWLTN